METCIPGIPKANVEVFCFNMLMSDGSNPHTKTQLSPIVLVEHIAKNQLAQCNPIETHKFASSMWARHYSLHKNQLNFEDVEQMDHCVYAGAGGWNTTIDFMMRLLRIRELRNSNRQMHFIAHLANEYYRGESLGSDMDKGLRKEAGGIFNAVLSPILYPILAPSNYFFLPVMNYLDYRFYDSVDSVCSNAESFIKSHSNYIDFNELNDRYTKRFIDETEDLLKKITSVKGSKDIQSHLESFFDTTGTQILDIKLCESYDSFRFSKVSMLEFIDLRNKLLTKLQNNIISLDQPSEIVDELLDIRTSLKKGM